MNSSQIHCDEVLYGAVQCGKYDEEQCSAVQYSAVCLSTSHYGKVKFSVVW